MTDTLRLHPEVAEALDAGRPVVALESTLIAHGLPRPDNLRVGRELEKLARAAGATPATIGVVAGVPTIGLDDDDLVRIAERHDVVKLSVRDLPTAVALGRDGATTVAATAHLAARAGIRVFATGGLGGVHRGARDTWDESADLAALAATRVVVVCSGVKSVLDVGATLERLETLGVPVVGFGTDRFPGFYLTDSGHPLDWSVAGAEQVADVLHTQRALGLDHRALVVANPIPETEQLDPDRHDAVLAEGLQLLKERRVTGKDVTPFLLDHFHRATHGASLEANVNLVRHNVEVAAAIARACTQRAP